MNKASGPEGAIDADAAAALMAPLTDLVIRAGAAILAVNRTAMCVVGTKEFIPGRHVFRVNLALVPQGAALLGIIGARALGLVWRGWVGRGGERLPTRDPSVAEPIHTRPLPKPGEPWIVAVSRSHGDSRTEAFIDARPGAIRKTLGSAVKFGPVAAGAAHIYPPPAPTSDWDLPPGLALPAPARGV